MQRGRGEYTLCERCNNNTGSWYGADYVEWAQQGFELVSRIPTNDEQCFFISFCGRPLRFLKQVVTMFFSVCSENFADQHPALVKFVLDWREVGLPPGYLVDLVLVRGHFGRSSGPCPVLAFDSGTVVVASEIAHPPFAFRLILPGRHSPVQRHGAIEEFSRYGPDTNAEVWLYTIAGHVVTGFPGDYRGRERVEREAGVQG